ncbi:MAG: hypothetical protein ACOX9R_08340 [Armatimonadota bacterium]|jgi:hypothetical protein
MTHEDVVQQVLDILSDYVAEDPVEQSENTVIHTQHDVRLEVTPDGVLHVGTIHGEPVETFDDPGRYELLDAYRRAHNAAQEERSWREQTWFCAICEGVSEHICRGGEGTYYEGDPVCEMCYCEAELLATLRINPSPDASDPDCEEHLTVTSVCNEALERGFGPWQVTWHSTDPWRGYFELETPQGWVHLQGDALLWGHPSEEMLVEFHRALVEALREADLVCAVATCRTSNVFSTAVDWYVHIGEDEQATLRMAQAVAMLARAKAAVDYDNPSFRQGILLDFESIQPQVEALLGRPVQTDMDIADAADELLKALST